MEPKLQVSYVPTRELVPYANNAKEHTDEQIDQICKSIREFGNCDPVGVWHDAGGTPIIVEGHGRVLALRRMGVETCPVISLDHLTDEQRREYTIVHNQLTMNTGFDEDMLAREMEQLSDFDWEAMGFFDIGDEDDLAEEAEERYSQKMETPIYEPFESVPELGDCVDTSKYDELMDAIEASDVSEDDKWFLRLAATRHISFSYSKVADYYAAAPAEVQRLMEDSALVIIDFDKAIENGFVRLNNDLQEILDRQGDDE